MKKLLKFLGILIGIFALLFGISFAVYFFNLDMKLTSWLEPYLDKIYDHRKREKTL